MREKKLSTPYIPSSQRCTEFRLCSTTACRCVPNDALSFDCAIIEFRLGGNRVSARLNCRQVEIQLPPSRDLTTASRCVPSLYE
ncbi:MAG: hypothetical protein V7L20_18170 [Nostoc sp.]|uniref:hypothetical protein n=1 Tax=Nostoc sp. TaxID=1180 RepID=UPI002FF4E404